MCIRDRLLFAELLHSLFSLDDKLNVAQSVIIHIKFMSISMMSMDPLKLGFAWTELEFILQSTSN